MSPKIASIQIGKIVTDGDPESTDMVDKQWTSAFGKRPITGPATVTPTHIVGDEFGNTKYHGGVDKAVLCYAGDHYRRWKIDRPGLDWGPGAMGENLTIDGLDESSVCIGDVFLAGEVEFQVSQPRQPCWKINRFHGVSDLLKEVAKTGRTGWYMRVRRPGTIVAGQSIERIERHHPAWTVARAMDVLLGREKDESAKRALFDLPELSESFR